MQLFCTLIVISCYLVEAHANWAQVAQWAANDPRPVRNLALRNNHQNNHDQYYHHNGSPRRQFNSRYGECHNDYKFDYLQLSLQWAPGYCRTSPEHCTKTESKHFTVHGMWPQWRDNFEGPSFCCFENKFDRNTLKPIMQDLSEFWPSLISQDNYRFWQHEWLKHGTCAKDVSTISGELNYFGSTVNLVKSMPILSTLAAAGIVPSKSKTYKAIDIQNALRQITKGTKVMIDCDLEHDQPVPILKGINVCLDTKMNFIDCRPSKSRCMRDIYFVQ